MLTDMIENMEPWVQLAGDTEDDANIFSSLILLFSFLHG